LTARIDVTGAIGPGVGLVGVDYPAAYPGRNGPGVGLGGIGPGPV